MIARESSKNCYVIDLEGHMGWKEKERFEPILSGWVCVAAEENDEESHRTIKTTF